MDKQNAIDVRFVAASNKDLNDLISRGEFREDLFYRLNVFPMWLPPLRERRDDIPMLLNHFLAIYTKNTGKDPKKFSETALKVLTEYHWPGNVRELQNLVERLFTITKDSTIQLEDISSFDPSEAAIKDMPLKNAVRTFEKRYISAVLKTADGNRKKASEILGIHRNTLLAKMNELGLSI